MTRVVTILLLALLCGCDQTDPDHSRVSSGAAETVRIVGYRFNSPGEDHPGIPTPSGFSLLGESAEVDFASLNELKVKEATLTEDQQDRLMEAVYADHPVTSAAACYDPHHLFVFYDADCQVHRAIEICFACLNIHTQPELEEAQWRRHDFRSLARLCDEIGIGMTSRTAEDLIEFWDETGRLGSKKSLPVMKGGK